MLFPLVQSSPITRVPCFLISWWRLFPEAQVAPAFSDSIAFQYEKYFAVCHQFVILSGCPPYRYFCSILSFMRSIQHVDRTSFLHSYDLSLFFGFFAGRIEGGWR